VSLRVYWRGPDVGLQMTTVMPSHKGAVRVAETIIEWADVSEVWITDGTAREAV